MLDFITENSSYTVNNRNNTYAPVVSIGEWILIHLLMIIPIVNIVLLIIWAIDSNSNPNKSNWAKAYLLIIAIQFVFIMLIVGIFISSIMNMLSLMMQ